MEMDNNKIIINNKRKGGRRRSSTTIKYLLYIVFLITLSIFGCITTYRLILFEYDDFDYYYLTNSNNSTTITTSIISAPKQHSRGRKSFNNNENEKKKKNHLQHNHSSNKTSLTSTKGKKKTTTQLLSPNTLHLSSNNNNNTIGEAGTPKSKAIIASEAKRIQEVERQLQQNPSKEDTITIAGEGQVVRPHDTTTTTTTTTTTSTSSRQQHQFQMLTSSLKFVVDNEASSLLNNVTSYLHSILPSNNSNTFTKSLDVICPQKPTYEIHLLLQKYGDDKGSTGIQTDNQSSSSSPPSSSYWIIQTYDDNGNRKTKGGDIFFVTYTSLTGLDNTTKQRLIHEQDEYWKNLHNNNNNNSSSSTQTISRAQKNKNRASRQQQQPQQQPPQGPNQLGKYGRLPPTAVAIVVDNDDGTYTLNFKSVPFVAAATTTSSSLEQSQSQQQQQQQKSNNNSSSDDITIDGIWKIHMEYTCGMGRMVRPSKDDWKTGGYLYQQMFRKQLLATSSSITTTTTTTMSPEKNLVPVPYINEFSPSITANNNNNIDLSKYDKIVSFGDSLMNMFVGQRDNYMKYYHSNIVEPKDNYGPFIRYDRLQQAFKMLDKFHGDLLRNNNNNSSNKKVALLMGSGAWEMAINEGNNVPIQGYYFDNSIKMYKEMVLIARKRYPNVDIIWKSPQAIHITNVDYDTCLSKPNCNTRIRYVSNSISYYLYEQQKKIMVDLMVPFLDLWEICYLSPYAHFGVDFQHYHEYFNMLLLDMYYPQEGKNNGKIGPTSNLYNGDLHSLKKYAIQSWA